MSWERCPHCGSDHVVPIVEDRCRPAETINLLVDPGPADRYSRNPLPVMSLREERIDLHCNRCDRQWRA